MNQQPTLLRALTSQVGRKILTGATGVLLVLFIIEHLSGNLLLLDTHSGPFNGYAEFLEGFGELKTLAEIGLGVLILLHAYIGIAIAIAKRKTRAQGYHVEASKGGPSKKSLSSRSMIITGLILLAFIVFHLIQFRFGPAIAQGYSTILDGKEVRDVHRLVYEQFQNPIWVVLYCGIIVMLGFHLRHGIWSALQSLGAMKPRASKSIYGLAFIMAALIVLGFFILPIWIYLKGGHV
jgi:succinate dehydrogenase / fumarate reductase cytochrome b subunit